jgi:hypothetical protein
MDHLRNYLPSASGLLFTLLFTDLHLSSLDFNTSNTELVNCAVNRLKLINKKVLLNLMFILKAIIIHLKQEVSLSINLKTILTFILAVIQIVYDYSSISLADAIEESNEI